MSGKRKNRAAIILAAGEGTRMKSELPKVAHEVCGRPMLAYVLDACRGAEVSRIIVVYGHRKEVLEQAFAGEDDLIWVEQAERKGTGHAVMMCEQALDGHEGNVAVVAGDMPLVRPETMKLLFEKHEQSAAAVTLGTTVLDEPTGYGRIRRDERGELRGIVEHADCTPEQLAIREVNPSYYCFDRELLQFALQRIDCDNAKGEYYITDALHVLIQAGHRAVALEALRPEEATGINSRGDLAAVGRLMQDRMQETLMAEGVTIIDPASTWIDSGAVIERDTVLLPFSYIEGGARIGRSCRIGPFAHVRSGDVVEAGSSVGTEEGCRPGNEARATQLQTGD